MESATLNSVFQCQNPHVSRQTPFQALAGVARWIECQPANQRVIGSIPSLGHMPGLRARSPLGGA